MNYQNPLRNTSPEEVRGNLLSVARMSLSEFARRNSFSIPTVYWVVQTHAGRETSVRGETVIRILDKLHELTRRKAA